jgi:hypothetical protein
MRILFVIIIVASFIGLSFISKTKTANKPKETRSVVGSYAPVAVLELFTSEGCSSCPPADRLLPELVKLDSNIIPLSFHVDYWNRLGWTDPFSSSEYSERQREYVSQLNLESAYTPQLVVNGEYELVGSNRGKAESAIKEALKEKSKVRLTIDNVRTAGQKLSFTIHAEGDFKKTDLLAAIIQKDATMKVKAGENSGATLSHINVVRSFSKQAASAKNEFELSVPANLVSKDWKLIVFAQQNDLKIIGAVVYEPVSNNQ